MADPVTDLGVAVDATVGTEESAGVLIQGFGDYVRAHVNDPAALLAYVDKLNVAKDSLAASVAANPLPA